MHNCWSGPQISLSMTKKKKTAADEDDLDLDLSAGVLDKSNDPVRLYLREMGIVPLLNREGEVTIAKRIERGQIKTHKAISRSPIAVERLLKIGDDLAAGKASIRETVVFSEQAEISIEEDKAEEYLRWTLEGHRQHPPEFPAGAQILGSIARRTGKIGRQEIQKAACS